MNEPHAKYGKAGVVPASLTAFKNRPCALPYCHPDYVPPTPEEVAALTELAGWSQRETALIVGVNYNPKKGSTTVRKWKAPVSSPEHRAIPFAAWWLLLEAAGVVTTDDVILALKKYA
ncbi:MAG: hypothetical protein OQK73_05255 [Gammaproteobacteria bacterium]|nr:hypothetical protein [Gammaproteobacteria bacterium]